MTGRAGAGAARTEAIEFGRGPGSALSCGIRLRISPRGIQVLDGKGKLASRSSVTAGAMSGWCLTKTLLLHLLREQGQSRLERLRPSSTSEDE